MGSEDEIGVEVVVIGHGRPHLIVVPGLPFHLGHSLEGRGHRIVAVLVLRRLIQLILAAVPRATCPAGSRFVRLIEVSL